MKDGKEVKDRFQLMVRMFKMIMLRCALALFNHVVLRLTINYCLSTVRLILKLFTTVRKGRKTEINVKCNV